MNEPNEHPDDCDCEECDEFNFPGSTFVEGERFDTGEFDPYTGEPL